VAVRGYSLTYPRLLLVALVVTTAVSGGYAAATSTAAFGSYNPGWDGSQSFRALAEANADTTVARDTSAYASTNASETTAVVLSPDSRYSDADVRRVRSFLDDGGTLVVAGDLTDGPNRLLDAVGAASSLDGRLVRDERNYYRTPALPVATNVSEPLAGDVDSLTLNHATVVTASANATVLVRTSAYAYLDENRNGSLDATETIESRPVVVSENLGNGTVVVASDPSVFINAMLDREGNRQFATHLVSQRSHVLLDYSHSSDLPAAAVVLLAIEESQPLQLGIGFGMLALAAGLRPAISAIAGAVTGLRSGDDESIVSEDVVVAAVAARHPDWDESTLRRVTQSIRSGSVESGTND
jgi:hypothetical protein